jgi:hypothetical protein
MHYGMLSTVIAYKKEVMRMSAENNDLLVLMEGQSEEAVQACSCTTGPVAVR